MPPSRSAVLRRRAGVAVVGTALLVGTLVAGTASAESVAATSLSASATNVAGYCSFAGGFQNNIVGTVTSLRLTVSPSSPRAGAAMRVTAAVKQTQHTPTGQYYPAGFLQGQVVIGLAGHSRVLIGPTNRSTFTGGIFTNGWTATRSFTAPASGRAALVIRRIVYNARGGGNGSWGSLYSGFDLVCSGGANPTTKVTAYAAPRLKVTVRP